MVTRLISLLRAASQCREDLPLATFDEEQIRWAIETGLGPLLFRTTKAHPQASTSPLWPLLQGADLTARMLTSEQLDAMDEIIDACEGRVPTLTLLKGISICEQYYPEPHLRPMRDIDFLVEATAHPTVESLLFKLGYRQQSASPPEVYERLHHSMPFFHPQRGVWVEVHRGLFAPKSKVSTDKVFSLENIRAQLRPSEFHGRKVSRLSDELQIVYIASHWAQDFKVVGGMVEMADLIYLLKNAKDTLNWEQIFSWLPGSAASTDLYLMLTALAKYHLIDIAPEILQALFLRQQSFGQMNLKIVHTLIDRYLVDGRAFGQVLNLERLDFLWKTLLSPNTPSRNLKLFAQHFLRLRTRLYRLKQMLDLKP